MNAAKKENYANQAATIIKKLNMRKMEGYYCPTMGEAKKKVIELIGEGRKSVAYGGSMTIDETTLKQEIKAAGHELISREDYDASPEAQKELKARQVTADTFLMSTNAITLDGELINVDGRGNRVSYMIYGPEQVIILTGMNKVTRDVEDGLKRARNIAATANTVRLGCDTPCTKTGVCVDCLPHTICCQIVVTRSSIIPYRIKVVLVGEDVGY